MSFALPADLPPGRFVSREAVSVWVSDDFPRDVEGLWRRLLGETGESGLVPLLCRPDVLGTALGPDRVDAVRLEETLAADFAEYRRKRLPFWTDPTPVPVPEGVEPWPHDPGPSFTRWPGLAPGMPALPGGPTPEEAAFRVLTSLVDAGLPDPDACRLVLVPARRTSDALALLGWSSEAPQALLCALLRSWEDRFGARLVAVVGSELHVSVARPPVTAEHTALLALEHVLSTADNIVDDPPTPFPEYAAGLVGRTGGRSGGTEARASPSRPADGDRPRAEKAPPHARPHPGARQALPTADARLKAMRTRAAFPSTRRP